MTQPNAAKMAPPAITGRGPNLSTSQPSTGTSQVSTRMKMEKDSWMADSSVGTGLDGTDEQGPGVLQIGDEAHAENAEDELQPAIGWFGHGSLLSVKRKAGGPALYLLRRM